VFPLTDETSARSRLFFCHTCAADVIKHQMIVGFFSERPRIILLSMSKIFNRCCEEELKHVLAEVSFQNL